MMHVDIWNSNMWGIVWCDSKYGMCMNGTTIHCMNKAWKDKWYVCMLYMSSLLV